jgi:hypothetical protein
MVVKELSAAHLILQSWVCVQKEKSFIGRQLKILADLRSLVLHSMQTS